MEYEHSDSSDDEGTDDDFPPPQSGRVSREGRPSGTGRVMSGSGHYGRSSAPDQNIRRLEKDAYVAVLEAFTAQSEVITWRKEQVMVTLRQELGISDEQHLEILRTIRERRIHEDEDAGPMYMPNVDAVPDVPMGVSRKKQKSSHVPQATLFPPVKKSSLLSPPLAPPIGSGKWVPSGGRSRGKKSKGGRQRHVGGKAHSLGGSSAGDGNPWLGRRVKMRWPDDNSFYEAVVAKYDPDKDLHGLVYEIGTETETWEWLNLNKLPESDVQIVDAPSPSVPLIKRGPAATASLSQGVAVKSSKKGRGPGTSSRPSSGAPANPFEGPASGLPSTNWRAHMPGDGLDMKGFQTSLDALVKQVDKIAQEEDLAEIESVKRAAKEHEEMLKKALAEVGESSEVETDEEEKQDYLNARSLDGERQRNRQDSRGRHGDDDEDGTAADKEGSD